MEKAKKTLKVVARYADEWNFYYDSPVVFAEKSKLLDDMCEEIGRDPATLRRSIMIAFVIGKTEQEIQAHIDGQRTVFPNLGSDIKSWMRAGLIGGTPDQVLEQLDAYIAVGCSRFMFQQNHLDDLDSLALLAETLNIS